MLICTIGSFVQTFAAGALTALVVGGGLLLWILYGKR